MVKKNQFSIYKDLTKNNNPDIVLFSGSETEKIFKKKAEYQYIGKILGSKNHKLLINKKIKYKNILVCPEGLVDEYKIFLKSPETKQSLKELKIMGGFYDKDLNKWWIYKDNKNKNTILKTFKKLTTK